MNTNLLERMMLDTRMLETKVDILRHPDVALRHIEGKGRGVVVTSFVPAGTVLEEAPVLLLAPEDMPLLRQTSLWPYWFEWVHPSQAHEEYPHSHSQRASEAPQAIVLGVLSLVNHSSSPNAHFKRNFETLTLQLYAMVDIEAHQEVTIDYGVDLWFESK